MRAAARKQKTVSRATKAVGFEDPLGPYRVGGRRVSGTTVPVRVSTLASDIGPGVLARLTNPAALLTLDCS